MAMQRTVQTVTKIAFAILPPVFPAADRGRYASQERRYPYHQSKAPRGTDRGANRHQFIPESPDTH
jgi:hypothetical protein